MRWKWKRLEEIDEREFDALPWEMLHDRKYSIFRKIPRETIKDVLLSMDAQIVYVPKKLEKVGNSRSAGLLVTQQHKPFSHLYLPITGSVLMVSERQANFQSKPYLSLVDWSYLAGTRFRMILGSGQPVGILEYAAKYYAKQESYRYEHRRLSVIAERETILICFPAEKLYDLTTSSRDGEGDVSKVNAIVEKRILRALSLRLSTLVHHGELDFNKNSAAKMAWILHQKYLLLRASEIRMSLKEAAWYIGASEDDAAEAILELNRCKKGVSSCCRDSYNSPILKFDPQAMLEFYKESMRPK